jgi:hypothetical protein
MFDDRNQIKCEPCKGEGYVEVTKFLQTAIHTRVRPSAKSAKEMGPAKGG